MIGCKSILLCLFLRTVLTRNILFIYDVPSPSHQIWNYAFAEGLMEKGYNITMVGSDVALGKITDKYHPLSLGDINDMIHEEVDIQNVMPISNALQNTKIFYDYTLLSCNYTYNTQSFQTLLNYPKDFFDLIIIDVTCGPCMYPLIEKFNYPPTIGVTAFLLPPHVSSNFGGTLYPSYVPFYNLAYTDNMNFFQRTVNLILTELDLFFRKVYVNDRIRLMAKKRFGEDVNLESLERHISLVLCNLHPVFLFPQSLPPNIIPVGGLHVRPVKKLPKDLQLIMHNAANGVILMSLGTNIRSDKLNLETRHAILDAFSKLNQTVLWKFESNLSDVPKNVIIRKWLPQSDILAHPNVKLFIGHGGALSTYEAVFRGVPIIGIPFFVDQLMIVNTMVEKNLIVKVELSAITSKYFLDSINDVLLNPMYSRNIKEMSRRINDEPQTPLDRAVFWTEYVLRHNGSHFLDVKPRHTSLFVSTSTDVILFLILVAFLLVYLLYLACKIVAAKLLFRHEPKQKVN